MQEQEFTRELIKLLSSHNNFEVLASSDKNVDLLVHDQTTGKTVAIEFKDAGSYGELPISTFLPIADLVQQTDKFQKLLLVSFSKVPDLLRRKLNKLNVDALTKPSVSQVVERVQLALSA